MHQLAWNSLFPCTYRKQTGLGEAYQEQCKVSPQVLALPVALWDMFHVVLETVALVLTLILLKQVVTQNNFEINSLCRIRKVLIWHGTLRRLNDVHLSNVRL